MRKGFTLVELLAVIVILAIIAVITIPMIKGVIDKVKLGSLEDSVYGLKSAAEIYFSSNEKMETTEFICSDNGCISNTGKKLDYKGKVEGKVKLFSDGKVSICLTDDNYASSILANEKKATTKMGGCDEETYEISEVIAIEKYNEVKNDYDVLNNDFLSVKNTLYNKKIITDVNHETQLINSDITSYSTGVNNLVDSLYSKKIISSKENTFNQMATESSNYGNGVNNIVTSLYNKTVITSKENTFEQMASEVDDLNLNQGEAQNKKAIVDGLIYSGLGVSENMSWEQISNILLNRFPQNINLMSDTSWWTSSGTVDFSKSTTYVKVVSTQTSGWKTIGLDNSKEVEIFDGTSLSYTLNYYLSGIESNTSIGVYGSSISVVFVPTSGSSITVDSILIYPGSSQTGTLNRTVSLKSYTGKKGKFKISMACTNNSSGSYINLTSFYTKAA